MFQLISVLISVLISAVDQAPTDLLQCVLVIVCGLLVAAVCWISKSVVEHGQDIARLEEKAGEGERKFDALDSRLARIESKLDKVLESR